MNAYGIRAGYNARLHPAYFKDVRSDGKLLQPEVLPMAAHLARRLHCTHLIDIGCGRGQNLMPYMQEFAVIGVDYGPNIDYCRSYATGQWIDCDLEVDEPGLRPATLKQSVVVCADVIEHLIDPTILMQTLAYYAEFAEMVILTTPDRERTYGIDHGGPPGNPHHVREWSLLELQSWVRHFTPHLAWKGWTRSNNVDTYRHTLLLILNRTRRADEIARLESLFTMEAYGGDQ